MIDLIVGGIILLILGGSISRIVIAKKKGIKCIGCDAGATCGKNQPGVREGCSGGCGQGSKSGCQGCPSKL